MEDDDEVDGCVSRGDLAPAQNVAIKKHDCQVIMFLHADRLVVGKQVTLQDAVLKIAAHI